MVKKHDERNKFFAISLGLDSYSFVTRDLGWFNQTIRILSKEQKMV